METIVPVMHEEELATARQQIDAVTVSPEVAGYVTALVQQTRQLPSVELGASPRAALHLLTAAKASARLSGRAFVTPDDVAEMARPVLAHRLILRPEAELEGFRAEHAIQATLQAVPVPR
jgi:MoxR-like ATPase